MSLPSGRRSEEFPNKIDLASGAGTLDFDVAVLDCADSFDRPERRFRRAQAAEGRCSSMTSTSTLP
ncbi:hypothetical protein [Roseovarius sp. M141]|uniref:hypothetical protein n=1 Tax=Roseovarius sp. M141 TaxID=2583806 RepID=UPI0020CE2F79|nr:hypothetical protein [Roseovarius sp. M141]